MARRIRISLPLVDRTFKTYVSTDYTPVATTTLQTLNSTSFIADDLIVIGEPTEELTEAKKISSITDIDTISLASALNFSHPKGTPIYKVLWDFVSIESRASSTGTFAEITQSPLQWDNKNNETIYYDESGTDITEYRFRFYNSVTVSYAEYSPTITGAGFSKQQVGYMIRSVREIVNDKERKIVSDDEIIRFFNLAQDIIYGQNPKYWFLLVDTYKLGTGISTVGGTNVYDLDNYANFGHLDRLRFKYDNGSTQQIYDLTNQNSTAFDINIYDLSQTGNDYAEGYKLLPPDSTSTKGYLQIFSTPVNAVGTLYPLYYRQMATLDTVEDSTPVPLPNLLENFAIGQIEKIKGNETKAKIYEDMFYGTPPKSEGYRVITGLALLDSMDEANKRPSGQPRSLWTFRGQGGVRYGRGWNNDFDKENYF